MFPTEWRAAGAVAPDPLEFPLGHLGTSSWRVIRRIVSMWLKLAEARLFESIIDLQQVLGNHISLSPSRAPYDRIADVLLVVNAQPHGAGGTAVSANSNVGSPPHRHGNINFGVEASVVGP